MTPDIRSLSLQLDLDYAEAKNRYDMECELLRIKREQFYAANPDFPNKNMYLQVTAPPQRIIIKEI